jgi:hypothetical protein
MAPNRLLAIAAVTGGAFLGVLSPAGIGLATATASAASVQAVAAATDPEAGLDDTGAGTLDGSDIGEPVDDGGVTDSPTDPPPGADPDAGLDDTPLGGLDQSGLGGPIDEAPGTDPGTDPGTTPGTDPGTTPGTGPGTTPPAGPPASATQPPAAAPPVTNPSDTKSGSKPRSKKVRVRRLQRLLNRFIKRWLRGIQPLKVNGKAGAATKRRIKLVKYYLGYTKGQNAKVTARFLSRMAHPRDPRYSSKRMIRTGTRRRAAQRAQG